MKTVAALRTAIVGLRGPGLDHAACIATLAADFSIIAGCDLAPEARSAFSAAHPVAKAYADFSELLAKEKPAVVVLATSEVPRCALALQAVAANVRGLYIEKPIAVSFGEARRMVAACAEK